MVDELGSARIVVQQSLHGYGDGHRLLAESSSSVMAVDARAMLVLSDVSAARARLPIEGYITGYPLSKSGKYVLARTWSAPEMSRPGCVWTHSILIDFADLARMRSTADLDSLFHRPEGRSFEDYTHPLRVNLSAPPRSIDDAAVGGALLRALYGKTSGKVFAPFVGREAEATVLALWMQQWPRLRRSFRFCTFSGSDRSIHSEIFDLQLVDKATLSHRFRVTDAIIASVGPMEERVWPLLEDLRYPDQQGLRSFLHLVGGDVSGGRLAMLPLTRLFVAVTPELNPRRQFDEAISLLDVLGVPQASTARTIVLKRILDDIESLDDRALEFVIENIESLEILEDEPAERLGRTLWARRPCIAGGALRSRGILRHAVELALASLDQGDIIAGLALAPSVAEAVVAVRPELLSSYAFWRIAEINVDVMLDSNQAAKETGTAMLVSIIMARRSDLISKILSRFGSSSTIEAIEAVPSDCPAELLAPWIGAVSANAKDLAGMLMSGRLRQRSLLIALARATDPEDLPNDFGQDPWVQAIENAIGSVDSDSDDYLAAFLLSRALGSRSRQPDRLAAVSFQRVYRSLASNRMQWDAWRLLYQRLSWVMPWLEWDRCKRVVRAVVDKFISLDLDAEQFGRLTDDALIFSELAIAAAETGKGRRYLEGVRRRLNDVSQEWARERVEYLRRLAR